MYYILLFRRTSGKARKKRPQWRTWYVHLCVCVCGQRSLTSQSRKVQGIIQQDIRKSYCTYNHVKVHCISLEAKIGYRCVICGLVVSVFTWIVSASVAIETLDFHSKTGRRVQFERVKVMP